MQRFTCPKCNGLGGWGAFGPCGPQDVHHRHPCKGCNGNGFVMMAAPPQPCSMCQGKGGHGPFGPCSEEDVHYKSPCKPCGGNGFLVTPYPAQLPPLPMSIVPNGRHGESSVCDLVRWIWGSYVLSNNPGRWWKREVAKDPPLPCEQSEMRCCFCNFWSCGIWRLHCLVVHEDQVFAVI